ncbi:hypothetical protein ACFSBZ_15765 [Amnibacterium flavum]|nr:hypothetical protein [Amnibacterium flavum]
MTVLLGVLRDAIVRDAGSLVLPHLDLLTALALLGGVALAGVCVLAIADRWGRRAALRLALLGAPPVFPRARVAHPVPVPHAMPDAPGRRLPRAPGATLPVV